MTEAGYDNFRIPLSHGKAFAFLRVVSEQRNSPFCWISGAPLPYRETVEIAAFVAAHGAELLQRDLPLPPGAVEAFWDRSQKRLRLWISAIDYYSRKRDIATPAARLPLWQDLEPVLGEILVSEVLVRVWSALLTGVDKALQIKHYEPIARHVMLGHLDARRRGLKLLLDDPALTTAHLSQIDLLRRKVERWSDMLLAHIPAECEINDFVYDLERVQDFSESFREENAHRSSEQVWSLMLAGLRLAFPDQNLRLAPPHEFLQYKILGHILDCFPTAEQTASAPFKAVLERFRFETPAASLPAPGGVSFTQLRNQREELN